MVMRYPKKFEIGSPIPFARAFSIPLPNKKNKFLSVIASENPDGWNHVSVSLKTRTPTWEEMSYIKNIFFDDESCCLQFHPKKSQYVNLHDFCLHIWEPPDSIKKLLEVSA